MIYSIVKLLRVLTIAAVLSACAGPQIFHPQLSTLDKGLARGQVVARLQLSPMSTRQAIVGRRIFEFDEYRMNDGMQTEQYFLAYEQNRLVFWGYVAEFRRQPDVDLSQAMSAVLRSDVNDSKH